MQPRRSWGLAWAQGPRGVWHYRTRDLILAYYDAYASGALHTWLGPEDKREPTRHSMETLPEGI